MYVYTPAPAVAVAAACGLYRIASVLHARRIIALGVHLHSLRQQSVARANVAWLVCGSVYRLYCGLPRLSFVRFIFQCYSWLGPDSDNQTFGIRSKLKEI